MRLIPYILCLFGVAALAQHRASSGTVEPDARLWRPWLLTAASEIRPDSPPQRGESARELLAVRTAVNDPAPELAGRVAYWSAGSPNYRWQQVAMANTGFSSFPGFRALALMNVAIADAEIATWEAKYFYNRPRPAQADRTLKTRIATPDSPSYPSEHAAAAGAAAAVLSYLFPANQQAFNDLAQQAGDAMVAAGIQYPSDIAAGLAVGRAAAERAIQRGRTDGSEVPWAGAIPSTPGSWTGTNPVNPQIAKWRTWVLTDGSQLRPSPPPAFNSPELAAQLATVKNFNRTVASNTAVYFWASAFVYKLWGDILEQKIFEYGLAANPPRAARAYALTSVAQFDALIACWDAKYAYWSIRPSQMDPSLTTVVPTPNFPGYVAAHATLSQASATMLSYLFPAEATYFNSQAAQAASSRVWGGIHIPADTDVGLKLGEAVSSLVIKRAQSDGSR